MKQLTLILISFFSLIAAHSQDNYTIKGSITNIENEAVIGADVILKKGDSTLTSSYTEEDGTFTIYQIKNGSYTLEFNSLGFSPIFQDVVIKDIDIDLGVLQMTNKIEVLTDVIVKGDVQAVRQDGDTSTFNASAYKVNPDASTEDLIRKMPGVDLSGGSVQAQGEKVTKVLVDGKPFFGDDATATLKNIPAEVVSGIQIYDERSEQSQLSGFDDGNTTKTLNIITRPDKRQGTFGKVYAGYGFPDEHYYNVGGVLNFFKGNQKITLLGQTNNINIQNFSSEDMGGGGGGRGGRRSRGNSDMMVNSKNGLTRTNAFGLNYTNVWKDKLKLSGSYFFNNANNTAIEEIERTYISTEQEGQRYRAYNNTTTEETMHRFNLKVEYQIDSANYVSFTPSLRLQQRSGTSTMSNSTFFDENNAISNTNSRYDDQSDAFDASYRFLYNYSFNKKGRTLSLSNNSGYNFNTGTNNLNSQNRFEDTLDNFDLNQEMQLDNNGWNTYANLNYTEPLTEKIKTQINAGIRYQETTADKKTFDFDNAANAYTSLNAQLSNEFESRYTTRFAGLALGYSDSVYNFNVGANVQNALLDNERILPIANTLKNEFFNVLPYAAFTYNIKKGSSIRLRYFTSTNTPSVNQLQDVVDNSNTNVLRTGNPLLTQNFEQRIFANYRTSNPQNNSNFFIMVMANFVNDYVGNSTIIATENSTIDGIALKRGMQYIKPVNLNGYYRVFSHMSYGFRIKPIKSNLNITAGIGTVNTPGLINENLNYAKNNTASLNLNLSSNINENIDFNISTRSSYSDVKNSLNTRADNSYFNQNTRLDLNYILPFGLFVNTQLDHQSYQGLGADFNQDFLLWNMSVGYKFMKKRAAEIKISVYDLLNQNQSISRSFTDIYTEDAMTNVLRQYFMLTFTYNIRNFKGKSSEQDFKSGDATDRGRPGHGRH